jgi:hypothetical protein
MTTQIIALLAAIAFGFVGGWRVEHWRNNSAQLEAQAKATAKFKKDEKRVDVAAEGHEAFKEKERIVYVEQEKKVRVFVDRPVYRNVCIDDDGVRLINDAIAGRADSGEPATAVPGSAAPAGR